MTGFDKSRLGHTHKARYTFQHYSIATHINYHKPRENFGYLSSKDKFQGFTVHVPHTYNKELMLEAGVKSVKTAKFIVLEIFALRN